jgi:hypothetical protein
MWSKVAILVLVVFVVALLLAALLVRLLLTRSTAKEQAPRRGGSPTPTVPAVSLRFRGHEVAAGERVDLETAASAPEVRFTGADQNALYTIVMYDPDAPTRSAPTAAPVRHWVAPNAKADASGTLRAGPGGDPYAGPDPPSGSGPHRYIVVVYRQSGPLKISFREGRWASPRARWARREFIQGNGLDVVGYSEFTAERPA